jgi:Sec-independent protein translocase protein TatA
MKSLGLGAREFKKGLDGVEDQPEEKKSVESEQKETSET